MMRIFAKIIHRIDRLWGHFVRNLRSRYYAALFQSCGTPPRPKIGKYVTISNPQNISCGKGCIFNHGIYLDGKGGISFGDNVVLSSGAKILTGSLIVAEPWVFTKRHIRKPVKIGNNVRIYTNVVVQPGVTIEDFVIVAAGSVVTKDLKRGWIYAGVPAKPVRRIWDVPEISPSAD